MQDQAWFEMAEMRERALESAPWVPLRALRESHSGPAGQLGDAVDFYGVGSAAVHLDAKRHALKLGWEQLRSTRDHEHEYRGGRYVPCDVLLGPRGRAIGIPLVISQRGTADDPAQWRLHQDLLAALSLKREGDRWVCIQEGYADAARLHRDDQGRPAILEMRADLLKDYLCARAMALRVATLRERRQIVALDAHVRWPNGAAKAEGPDWRWKGKIERGGVCVVRSELLREEFVAPAAMSVRVRGDRVPSPVEFVVDEKGQRLSAEKLRGERRWLWFKPQLMRELLSRRGGAIGWYTAQTGSARLSPGGAVHFGVSETGFVNAFCKDVAMLPQWEQKVWAEHGVAPQGEPCAELVAAHDTASPPPTEPPVRCFKQTLPAASRLCHEKLGFPLYRDRPVFVQTLPRLSRFYAVDEAGLRGLARDLSRVAVDCLDAANMQMLVPPPRGQRWPTLKTLEMFLASKAGPDAARSAVSNLHAIESLARHRGPWLTADCHEALRLANIDSNRPFVIQGFQLMRACADSLRAIAKILEEKF